MLIIGKVFEKCIANIIEPYFVFHENQFGYAKNGIVVAERYLLLEMLWARESKVLCYSFDTC